MSKYKTAKQLGILPEERKALIAFVKAPYFGKVILLQGENCKVQGGHEYHQDTAGLQPDSPECGTGGCIAGYVLQHALKVQGKRKLRGKTDPHEYIDRAWSETYDEETGDYVFNSPFLEALYQDGYSGRTVPEAKAVVDNALQTGVVRWDYTGRE